jgi:predicted metallopeptidase
MKITCTNTLQPKLRKHVIAITKFTVDSIFTKRQKAKLQTISIRIDKSLNNKAIHNVDAVPLAYMDAFVEDYNENQSPRNFIIWINPFFIKKNLSKHTRTTFMETIVHEIVHIKQAISGEMKQVYRKGKMMIKFHKKYYKLDSSNDSYWLFPWEVEARGHEKGVLNLYCIKYQCFREFPDVPLK